MYTVKKLPNAYNFRIYNLFIYNNLQYFTKKKIIYRMSSLKSYFSSQKSNIKILFSKTGQFSKKVLFSKTHGAESFLDECIQETYKYNHIIRFYSSEKCGQCVDAKSAENSNTSQKLQEISSVSKRTSQKLQDISSVSKRTSQLNYCGRQGTVSLAIVGGGFTTLSTFFLLKQNPAIKEIRLIDTDNSMRQSVCDIKQMDTGTKIRRYEKNSVLNGLRDINIVVLMDETNLIFGNNKGPLSQFSFSCNFVKNITDCMATACPNALVVVFTNPVTATLPLISEIYKTYNLYNPSKIIGSVALDSMKINAITANFLDLNPSCIRVPITGGVDSLTIVPLLSKTTPFNNLTAADQQVIIKQFKSASDGNRFGNEQKYPTLSPALAAAKFISTLICGVQNYNSICVANAFVRSNIHPSCQYLASEVQFGPNGIHKIFDLPKISSHEVSLIEQNVPVINKIVESVKNFVQTGP